jgi:hypothetical protein
MIRGTLSLVESLTKHGDMSLSCPYVFAKRERRNSHPRTSMQLKLCGAVSDHLAWPSWAH